MICSRACSIDAMAGSGEKRPNRRIDTDEGSTSWNFP